ncbi:hypothetical protein [Desulfosporosinus meridiei]|uniref:Nucleic acid-binding protein n=1 Tax=Desulfosporosinus meridiei (strain ATCC BAA-275 / DSM 13257 / KCTC 12902 / NCIMB 13706 / S10) TaxID=768704 RepID=J7ITB4_DESMD|nr:hypothetical protein [Desulfosporosinus meridiei]AFQ43404.1 hypothetical protein Desmer_1410 [Desulfosporosinus meridiei DSM 13257]
MKKICNQCQTEMIEDLTINVEFDTLGIKIKKKGKGLFNNISAKPKAAVCPNCGCLIFYIDEYKEFSK